MLILRAIIEAHFLRNRPRSGRQFPPLALFHAQGGGCDLCTGNLDRLQSAAWEDMSYGLRFVQTPYEAEIMVLTGSLTRVVFEDIQNIWQVMPAPKGVISIGNCAIGESDFAGLYAVIKGGLSPHLKQPVKLNSFIKGCPPSLDQIADGLTDMCRDAVTPRQPRPAEAAP